MSKDQAIEAIIRLIEHTTERHPHFECPRGLAIDVLGYDKHDLSMLDANISSMKQLWGIEL